MSTHTWPSTIEFLPESFDVELRSNVLVSTSPLTGAIQTLEIPGARWMFSMGFDATNHAEQAEREAFLTKLGGQANRVALWHPVRTVPRGNLLSAPVLASTAAAGATMLSISNAFGRNLLTYPSEFDNAVWLKARATVTPNAAVAADGTMTADKLVEDTTAANSHYLYRNNVPITAGAAYTLSVEAQAAERSLLRLQLADGAGVNGTVRAHFDLSSGQVSAVTYSGTGTGGSAAIADLGGGRYRCSLTGIVDAVSSTLDAQLILGVGTFGALSISWDGDGTSGLYIWGAQLEAGELTDYAPAATLLPGDMLSAGGELKQVVTAAQANAAGAMSVEVRPAMRAQAGSASPVVVDKPTGTFVLTSGARVPYKGSHGPAFLLEFAEVFG